jgi:hypothetical protein
MIYVYNFLRIWFISVYFMDLECMGDQIHWSEGFFFLDLLGALFPPISKVCIRQYHLLHSPICYNAIHSPASANPSWRGLFSIICDHFRISFEFIFLKIRYPCTAAFQFQ